MDLLSQLNPEQKRAVLHTEGPLLVLAGAGSGGTRVIAHRIARLIADGHAEPDRILAVTFTNKAAGEMRERVARLVDTGGRRPWVSTFHALCARILRREGGVRVTRDFVIYDSADQTAAMRRILRALGADDMLSAARETLEEISCAKNEGRDPNDLLQEAWDAHGELTAKAYERYRRTKAQVRALEEALIREAIPYKIVRRVPFYQRREIKDALAYLRLLINPDDDVSLRRVVNTPPRGIGEGTMTALEALAPEPAETGPRFGAEPGPVPPDSLWRRLNRAVDEKLLPPSAVTALRSVRDLIDGLAEAAASEPASELLWTVLDRSDFLGDPDEDLAEEDEARRRSLDELASAAGDYELREPDATPQGFVDRIALLSESDEAQGSEHAVVWLMTLHAAKGLEFPAVIIVGLEEGLFPHLRARDEALEDERRLFYVGMTRARNRLVLTSAIHRRAGDDEGRDSVPSRFLDEVPFELKEVEPVFWTPSGYACEDEGRSAVGVAPGTRVRHPAFGVGTVLSVEPLTDDMTVSFRTVGRKTLRAKFAKLTLA